jgi:aspartate kinase
MIVMKYGGTSVKDAAALANAARIVQHHQNRQPVVVLSAGAKVTDGLINLARKAAATNQQEALADAAALRERHLKTAEALLEGELRKTVEAAFAEQFDELEMLVRGVSILRELTPRVLDHFMSFGEQWSCLLLTHRLQQDGCKAEWVDSRSVIVTDDEFNKSAPLFEIIDNRVHQHIFPRIQKHTVVVTQGFVGATTDGITTTLGRGGSDYTAAIIGAGLDAEEIQIWTDVSGVLTANPKLVPDARPVREMTFNEAAELAYFGAKVLHPSTILPAVKKKIPVRVLNSMRPEDEGTLITTGAAERAKPVPPNGDNVVKSIAHREGITIIRIQSTRMLMAHGFLARVFDIFARYKKSVDVISTSEVGISLTIDDQTNIDRIVSELDDIADVAVEPSKAVLSIVGENMKKAHNVPARVFSALGSAGVTIDMISHGGSDINITVAVPDDQVATALTSLHTEFFKRSGRKK